MRRSEDDRGDGRNISSRWGVIELPLADPDGHAVILVEVPEDHFLRRQL
jgi:hypothetical protein